MAAVYLCQQGEIKRCQMSMFKLLPAPITGDVGLERIPGPQVKFYLQQLLLFYLSVAGG